MVRVVAAMLTLCLWSIPQAASALQPHKAFHHYVRDSWSIEQGLPQITVLSIAQDRNGYLWVGTQAGLARFDGVRFTSYTPATEPALPGIWVEALHAASDGRLWIGTYKGVAIRDGTHQDGSGFATVPAADTTRWPALDVRAIAEDTEGGIWVATTAGVFRARSGQLHQVAGTPLQTQSLLIRKDGLWVGARGAVYHHSARTDPQAGWQSLPLPESARTAIVNRLVETQGRIWAATSHGLYVFANGAWRPVRGAPQLAQVPINLLYADNDGNLWVGGDVGLARFRDGMLAEFVDATGPGGISGLRSAFEDREGNLWLGSHWEGVIRLWDGWTRRYSLAEGLNDRIVWSLAPDPDGHRLWVGTNDGLSVLESGRFSLVAPGSALPHPVAYNLLAEPTRLWIGTRHGLAVIDHAGPYAGQVQQLPLFAPLASAQINGIVRDDDGTLWFVTTEGLYRLARGDRSRGLRRFGKTDGLSDTRTRFFYRDAAGRILIGTQSGLFEMRGERFYPVGIDTGLPRLDVPSILQLEDGRLLLGTLTGEIYFQDGGRWHELGEAQGMPANSPFFMTQYDGDLWVAGIRGISRVPLDDLAPLASKRIARVRGEMLLNERGAPNSGQQGYCCNGAGNSKGFLRDDTLWLPSRDGVVALDTNAIVKNAMPPTVAIERVQIGEQWRVANAISDSVLPENARDLSFQFTVLSFQDPKSNGLLYRLSGYDREWKHADPLIRTAHYTNLPSGDYMFEVRGSNNAGVPTNVPARLSFSIAPHFRETSLFRGLLTVLALTLMFAGYRYQQHRYRRQRHGLERLVGQRTEALKVANHRFEEASQTDPLTGLRNRRYLTNQLPADLAHYDRQLEQGLHQDEAIMFVLIDIDGFTTINDRHGHAIGDLVLRQLAQMLGGLVRSGDYVVRWSDKTFLLVLRPMPDRHVTSIGNRLRTAIAAHGFDMGNSQTLRLTASIGLSEYPLFRGQRGKFGWETVVELADQAMRHVKAHGRDGWAAFRSTDHGELAALLQDLHQVGAETLLAQGRLQRLGSAPWAPPV